MRLALPPPRLQGRPIGPGRVPPISMYSAAYRRRNTGSDQVAVLTSPGSLGHVPTSRLPMPCEAPWCRQVSGGPVCDAHRPSRPRSRWRDEAALPQDEAEGAPDAHSERSRAAMAMRLRFGLVCIVLFLAAASAVGCEALRPAADPLIPIPIRDVVLAVHPIERGARIEPETVALRAVPVDDTNSMAYTNISQVLGKVAVIEILELQLITPNLLVDE
jgi:SAF domain